MKICDSNGPHAIKNTSLKLIRSVIYDHITGPTCRVPRGFYTIVAMRLTPIDAFCYLFVVAFGSNDRPSPTRTYDGFQSNISIGYERDSAEREKQ